MKKTIFSLALFFWTSLQLFAQEREIIPLNEHFYPLSLGAGLHTYNNVKTLSKDGEVMEKIYTLENTPVEIRKTRYGSLDAPDQKSSQISKYSPTGELVSLELVDSAIGVKVIQVMTPEKLILELTCLNDACEGIFYPDGEENGIEVDRDVLRPSPTSREIWQKFIMKELKYPLTARRLGEQGTVWVGLKIDQEGYLLDKAVMNPNEVHPSLTEEVLRIMDRYQGGFFPAQDFSGSTIEAWLYLPVRFVLG